MRRAAGAGARPRRVLLLHGLGGNPAVWDRMITHLDEDHEVWDAELPWAGGLRRSGWGQDTAAPADALAELVRRPAKPSGAPFDAVVAHSYAANLLLEALASRLIAPVPTVLLSPFYRSSPDDFDWPTISHYLNDFHQTFAEALEVGVTGRHPRARRDWLARCLRDQIGPYGWMRFFETYLRTPFLDLPAVTAPTLVVAGGRDRVAPAAEGRALAVRLPGGRHAPLPDGGHFPMVEQPDLVAGLVSGFLRDAYDSDDSDDSDDSAAGAHWSQTYSEKDF
ncbi:alpha/beta fold hydrolase [Streptomyces sp. NPDC092296]|uniref:alpha/beta fold hydrolase n=1 Tax=Streptomyces sp. NPDC092296 TaxID=3366012 RepID=UPI00380B0269